MLRKDQATETKAWAPPVGLLALVSLGAFLLLAGPLFAPSVQLAGRDTSRLYYPVKLAIAEALVHGRLLFWDTWSESGVSILGQMTPGLLHPFTLLYVALPFDLAFKLNHLLALPLAGFSAFLLARNLGASRVAALTAAFAYGGSGALLSAASSNLPFALGSATLPLALAALLWLLREPSPRRLLVAATALALCAYAGDPQSMLIAAIAGLVLTWQQGRLRRSAWLLAWGAVALVLALPVALPAAVQLGRSTRGQGAASRLERSSFSTTPLRMLGLAVPIALDSQEDDRGRDTSSEYLGEGASPFYDSLCFGLPALLLAGAALGTSAGRTLLALGAVLLAAACGEALFVEGLLLRVVPLWRYFRYAEKLVTPACCFLAIAAAVGADRALGEGGRPRKLLVASAAVTICAATAWLSLTLAQGPLIQSLVALGRSHDDGLAQRFAESLAQGALASAGLAGLVALLAAARARSPRFALAGAAAACFASAMLTAPRALHAIPIEAYRGASLTSAALFASAGPSEGRWRVFSTPGQRLFTPSGLDPREARTIAAREAMWPQLTQLDGIESAASYFSAPDRSYEDAIHRAQPALLRLFGARFQMLSPEEQTGDLAGAQRSETGFPYQALSPQPRAFLLGSWHPARDADAALSEFASSSFDPHLAAVVPYGRSQQAGSGALRSVALSRPSPEQIDAQVETQARALLVVAEHHDPGWSASLDGQPAELLAVDALALGVEIPPGAHRVSFHYRPRGLVLGAVAALLCGAALLGWPRPKRAAAA